MENFEWILSISELLPLKRMFVKFEENGSKFVTPRVLFIKTVLNKDSKQVLGTRISWSLGPDLNVMVILWELVYTGHNHYFIIFIDIIKSSNNFTQTSN